MTGKVSIKYAFAAALALAGVAAATVPASAQVIWGGPYDGYYDYAPGPVGPGPYYAPYGYGSYGWGGHRHCDDWSIRGC